MGEHRTALILLLILFFTFVSISETGTVKAEAETIVVPDDYPTIASAIGNATDGDTVFVKKGTYDGPTNQTLVIDKSISFIGEDPEYTILNLHPLFGTAWLFTLEIGVYSISIQIEANDATLSGFTIRSPGTGIAANGDPDGCISVTGDRAKISNNTIATTILSNGNSIQIANNSINSIQGAVSVKGINSTIAQNTITNGITISGYYTRVISNNVTNRPTHPIIRTTTDFNLIYGNTITAGHDSYCIEIERDAESNEFIKNVMAGDLGIYLDGGNNNTFYANNINTLGIGINLPYGHNNTFYANNIANSQTGARLGYDMTEIARKFGPSAANNLLYHNNFINNTKRSVDWNWLGTNYWDNGSEGNYWSDYAGHDWNNDGIGDLPHYLLNGANKDSYPLMAPITFFDAGIWEWTSYYVDVISNSTLSDFSFNSESALVRFNVEGKNGTTGFCRVTIPKNLLDADETEWAVLVGGSPVTATVNEDTSNTYLYFSYNHSTKTVEIIGTEAIPESLSWTPLMITLVAVVAVAVVYRRRLLKSQGETFK
jgi:nitrous oxidase accessory protein